MYPSCANGLSLVLNRWGLMLHAIPLHRLYGRRFLPRSGLHVLAAVASNDRLEFIFQNFARANGLISLDRWRVSCARPAFVLMPRSNGLSF